MTSPEITQLALENETLKAELERIRNYSPASSAGCPLCKYENGVFQDYCAYHRENLEAVNTRLQIEKEAAAMREALENIDRESRLALEADDPDIDCVLVRDFCRVGLAHTRKLGLLGDGK